MENYCMWTYKENGGRFFLGGEINSRIDFQK